MIVKRNIVAVAMVTLGLQLPVVGFAQIASIDEVIISENRLRVPFSKNSRNLEILTQEQIRQLPARTLTEVLSYINGVDIRQRGPFGAQADIGIDGGSFEQTLVLLNGVKIIDPQTAHHNLNLPLPLDAIERIEVLRGPSSRIYGINGLTGSINIVTRQVEQTQVMAQVYSGSSFEQVEDEGQSGIYRGTGVQLGGMVSKKRHQHQLFLTREASNGYRYNTASESYRAFYQGQFEASSRDNIELMATYIANDFGANGFYAAPGDRESRELVNTAFFSLGSKHQLTEKLHISPRVSYRNNTDDYQYYRNDLSIGRSQHETNVVAAELNGRYQTTFGDFGVGAESRFEKIVSSNIGNYTRDNHGFYAEFRTERIQNMTINAGTYVNYNSQFGWQAFPGIDASYLFGRRWKIAVNAGSSQRIPSFTDLYLQQTGNVGNPNLVSEDAWQSEGLVQFDYDWLIAKAGVFYRDVANFIDWRRASEDLPYQSVNTRHNRMRGAHLSTQIHGGRDQSLQYRLMLGYTYLDPSVLSDLDGVISRYQIQSLKHQLTGSFNLSIDRWSFTTANRLLQRASANRYFVADLRVNYRWSTFDIYADVQNISDTQYIEAGAVPMPGRWSTLGLRYTWLQP